MIDGLLSHAIASAVRAELDDVRFELAETKRKLANVVRSGVVTHFDPKTNSVTADVGFETHPIPVFNHAGTGANWAPMKKGQQITLLCSDGDIANALCIPGGYHDQNKAPSQSADEDIVAQRGDKDKPARLRTTDDSAALEAMGNALKIEGGKITLTADKIILEGEVYLGSGAANQPAAMKGSLDTRGDALKDQLATKVFVK